MNVLVISDEVILDDEMQTIKSTIDNMYPSQDISFSICRNVNKLLYLNKRKFSIILYFVSQTNTLEDTFKFKKTNLIIFSKDELDSLRAWDTPAFGFVLRSEIKESLEVALVRLRYSVDDCIENKVDVHCFGKFEVLYNGLPVVFKRKKSLELLALLIDNRGADTSIDYLRTFLWNELEDTDSKKAYVRQLVKDIRSTFKKLGIHQFIINTSGGYMLNKNVIECDYFEYIYGKDSIKPEFYMTQYKWAYLE